jgi:hypothetical protein
MSLHDYRESQQIARHDYPFYALIMAAMRQADSENIVRLRVSFPEIFKELDARYHAPGGRLEGE